MLVIVTKVALMILFMMWVRWTLPRFRYDQLMDLAWKSLDPAGAGQPGGHGRDRAADPGVAGTVADRIEVEVGIRIDRPRCGAIMGA